MQPLILGSASPRRSALLAQLDVTFSVATVDIDEAAVLASASRDTTNWAEAAVQTIAEAKFAAFVHVPEQTLITADTMVECDDTLLGKPRDERDLVDMLTSMSGRALRIVTAIAVGEPGGAPAVQTVTTLVYLHALDHDMIVDYIARGVAMDKAGGIALQDEANHFIERVEGCWSNVVGLPLCAVATALDLPPAGRARPERCVPGLCGVWSRDG